MSPNLSFIGKCVGTLASADVVAQDAVRLALQSLSGCNSLLAYELCQLSVQRAWFRAARLQSWIAWCSSSAVHNVLKISAVALASSNQVVDKSTAAYVCKCLVSRLERNQFRSGVCTEHGRPRRLRPPRAFTREARPKFFRDRGCSPSARPKMSCSAAHHEERFVAVASSQR